MVYNSLFNYCEKPSYTKCDIPGDTKDTCMLCPEGSKYIDPVDGLCKGECPIGYFERDDMDQCRPCHESCYKCNWTYLWNCTECTGALYLVEHEGKCVDKCEEFNLTASNITNNLCTGFDSKAILLNRGLYNEKKDGLHYIDKIDINTFDNLEGKVINYTSKDYTVLWAFEYEKTLEANKGNLTLDPKVTPLMGDLDKQKCKRICTFFNSNRSQCSFL